MQLMTVHKNDYFTHLAVFSEDGKTKESGTFRAKEQLWTSNGVTMHIQGSMPSGSKHWGAGTYNCFGKKHLLSTGGGKSDATKKMANIVGRRDESGAAAAHKERMKKLGKLKLAMANDVQNADKQQAIKAAGKLLEGTYETFAYGGTRTSVCTFVLLDGMKADDVKAAFGALISAAAAGTWAEDEKRNFVIKFATQCVITHHLNGSQTTKDTIDIDVVKHSGSGATMYYIYHCNG